MRSLPLEEILRVWSQAPSAAAAARTLGMARRTLYYRYQAASLAEERHAIAQIVAAYEMQLTEERQARLQERVAAQAQLKAAQKKSAQERARLERKLARRSNTLERVMRVLRTVGARGAGTERTVNQQQEIERLTRENRALRAENKRLKSTRAERPQGPGDGPVIRRTRRLITLDDSAPV